MRHKSHIVPDWTANWNAADLKEFLRAASKCYDSRAQIVFVGDNLIRRDLELIQWLYKYGRDYRVLSMDYNQFSRTLIGWPHESRRQYKKRLRKKMRERAQRSSRFWDPLPYRVRNHHVTEKKELSSEEQSRRAWREEKQFNRDKSRFEGWRRGGSHKTWAKKYSNRAERRHVRERLHNDKEILPHRWFNDPWMWD